MGGSGGSGGGGGGGAAAADDEYNDAYDVNDDGEYKTSWDVLLESCLMRTVEKQMIRLMNAFPLAEPVCERLFLCVFVLFCFKEVQEQHRFHVRIHG